MKKIIGLIFAFYTLGVIAQDYKMVNDKGLEYDLNVPIQLNSLFPQSKSDNGKLFGKSKLSNKKNKFFKDIFGTLGLGIGQEYLFGIKGSLIKPFSFKKKKTGFLSNLPKNNYGFYPIGGYVSVDANGFLFIAPWGGIGLNGGISLPYNLSSI